jgi:hypothetical protein
MLRTGLSVIEVVRGVIKVVGGPNEMVAIDDGRAVRDVRGVVIDDRPVSPITSPVVPAPGETGKEAEPEA